MDINGNTKVICLIGHPVKHSFSPNMHNYLIQKYRKNNVYICFDIAPEKLEDIVRDIKTLGIEGCNITIPHKVEVMKYLDYIDPKASLIGAVNTIKNEGGILKGYNTDGIGFTNSILSKGYELKDKRIMILGAGGACRSIAVELASNEVKSIEIRNRSEKSAKKIIDTINKNFNTEAFYSNKDVETEDLNCIDILINTTPVGMESSNCPIDEKIELNSNMLVCDIVYKPHETNLIKWARRNNLEVIYGIDMLINQGLHAFYIWTGIRPNYDDEKYIKDMYENKYF